MKLKPIIGSQLSGSLAGLTASHNKGGAYLRSRATPVNPNSAAQQVVRNSLSGLSARWRDVLTPAQRDDWAAYAETSPVIDRIGASILLPPLSWYVACNTLREQAALAVVDQAPATPGFAAMGNVDVDVDGTADTADVTFDTGDQWVGEDEGALLLYVSRPQSPAINYFKGPYRFAGIIAGNATTPPTSPGTISMPFNTSAGQQVFWRIRAIQEDGRITPDFRGGVLVT